jgi:hypothetical protein
MKIPVTMIDGPCGGRTVIYGQPLPQILVIADKRDGIRYHDYRQTMMSQRYRHDDRCKCHDQAYRPVNLDIAR